VAQWGLVLLWVVLAWAPAAAAKPLGGPLSLEEELRQGPSSMRMASYVLWGTAGAAAAVTGAVFAGLATQNHRNVEQKFGNGHILPPQNGLGPSPWFFYRPYERMGKTLSMATVSIGGMAAVASAVLFFLPPKWQRYDTLKVGIFPMFGGAKFSLQWVLP